ncbi:MAG: adenylate kinase family protein [Planctomycetota bacterium]
MASDRQYRTVLLFGCPGSGKGTMGKVLGSLLFHYHLASGDIFRAMDPNSKLGAECRKYFDRGLLVPDDLTVSLWRSHVEQLIAQGTFNPDTDTLILDGIPRTFAQAKRLDDSLDVRAIFHLVAYNEQTMIQRLLKRGIKEGRADDASEEVIRRRMEVYKKETFETLKAYDDHYIFNINAEQPPASVLSDIVGVLKSLHQRG